MKSVLSISFLFMLFLGVSLDARAQYSSDDEIRFFKGSFEDLTSSANQSRKSYIIFFTKDHCPPCERMKADVFTDPTVVELISKKSLIYEADIQDFDGMDLAERYEVNAYPTLLIFSPKGILMGQLIGGQSVVSLIAFLEKLGT